MYSIQSSTYSEVTQLRIPSLRNVLIALIAAGLIGVKRHYNWLPLGNILEQNQTDSRNVYYLGDVN
jgi:hypothetical protein